MGVWGQKCGDCANYSGTLQASGFCRVWGAVVVQHAPLLRQCPHWTSREARQGRAAWALASETLGSELA